MRVEVRTEGGFAYFPALNKPRVLESESLPAPSAQQLRDLVDAANVFERPPVESPPRGAADYRRYTITVDDGTKRQSIQVSDPVSDPNLQALLSYVKTHAS